MEITEFAALIVAIAIVVAVVFLVTALNNLTRSLAKLEDTANQLRDEGLAAFGELRQLVADADAELDKVDIVLDRADQATTAISETSRRTHQAVQDPMIRTLAVASGTSRVARSLFGRKGRVRREAPASLDNGSSPTRALITPDRVDPVDAQSRPKRRRR